MTASISADQTGGGVVEVCLVRDEFTHDQL